MYLLFRAYTHGNKIKKIRQQQQKQTTEQHPLMRNYWPSVRSQLRMPFVVRSRHCTKSPLTIPQGKWMPSTI